MKKKAALIISPRVKTLRWARKRVRCVSETALDVGAARGTDAGGDANQAEARHRRGEGRRAITPHI